MKDLIIICCAAFLLPHLIHARKCLLSIRVLLTILHALNRIHSSMYIYMRIYIRLMTTYIYVYALISCVSGDAYLSVYALIYMCKRRCISLSILVNSLVLITLPYVHPKYISFVLAYTVSFIIGIHNACIQSRNGLVKKNIIVVPSVGAKTFFLKNCLQA